MGWRCTPGTPVLGPGRSGLRTGARGYCRSSSCSGSLGYSPCCTETRTPRPTSRRSPCGPRSSPGEAPRLLGNEGEDLWELLSHVGCASASRKLVLNKKKSCGIILKTPNNVCSLFVVATCTFTLRSHETAKCQHELLMKVEAGFMCLKSRKHNFWFICWETNAVLSDEMWSVCTINQNKNVPDKQWLLLMNVHFNFSC